MHAWNDLDTPTPLPTPDQQRPRPRGSMYLGAGSIARIFEEKGRGGCGWLGARWDGGTGGCRVGWERRMREGFLLWSYHVFTSGVEGTLCFAM